MSSSGGNSGGLNLDDQSNKVTGDPNETVSLPVSLSVPCENFRTDEKLDGLNDSTFDNEKLLEETIARTNQTSLNIDAQALLADIHAENQQLFEEVLKQMKKTNTTLAKQSELYDKLILGTSKSIAADYILTNPPDTNVKPGGKRLLGQEETSEAGSKKMQKLNSEEDRSSEDQKD